MFAGLFHHRTPTLWESMRLDPVQPVHFPIFEQGCSRQRLFHGELESRWWWFSCWSTLGDGAFPTTSPLSWKIKRLVPKGSSNPLDWKLKDWCPDKCTSKIIAKFLSAEAFNLQRLLSSNTLQSPPQRSTTPTTPSSAVVARVPAAASAGTRTGGNTDELGSSWIPIISRRYVSWFSYIGTWNWIKIQWPRFHEWFLGTLRTMINLEISFVLIM